MTIKMRSHLSFDFCFQEPGSRDVIGFDIYFHWRQVLPDGTNHTTRHSSELMLKAEGNMVLNEEDLDFVPLFPLRYQSNQKNFVVGSGKNRCRVPIASAGSGGNWYWQTFTTTAQRQPHLMNWLRRQKHFDVTEWDGQFRSTIWEKRGSIRLEHLRLFGRSYGREYLRHEKEEFQIR